MRRLKPLVTTGIRGLQEDSFPFRLYQKAKRLGVWNPADIDLTQDAKDWETLPVQMKDGILRLIAQFQAGEEAVTRDLLPLLMVVAKEGRIEEEMYLTTFLFEEAKHTEFFRLVLNALGIKEDLSHYHSETYHMIFNEILPGAMGRLEHDASPEAVAEASVVYNMFVEGVLAETGYYGFYQSLGQMRIMPGLLKGIEYLKKDESRHIAYGTFLLQRLIREHPPVLQVVIKKMEELAPLAVKLNEEAAARDSIFGPDHHANMMNFTARQLAARMDVLKKAQERPFDELFGFEENEHVG
ncbi:ribonucleotide-diphosphate reductase [Geobacillus sp. 46C-IIa]|uniref:R2-like ligand-binding oxidase n=1 Tax=Geobacillus sp. 46C-IIa TaxID=1963025 RepID=UPI0009BF90E1|nr:R2-like ligand-binding oxidase [Geobacillus sp. 46C-IIa]OQP04973.1 ribonucleotide-diphosphate reductase [Geobacillus sp. 46C-IIa]QNU27714.1 R2-like ligand-binding oxidase [Geobacillus sp. 46C-IIa]